MKTIRCNLTKACHIFATFIASLYKNMGILSYKFQEISIRSSISLVCVQSIEFDSIIT